VDGGEAADEPRCLALHGRSPSRLLVLGGPVAYRIRSSGLPEETITLRRRWETSMRWGIHLLDTVRGTLIVYESGVLLVGDDLAVRWHQRKYSTDAFDRIDGEHLCFRDARTLPWKMSLDDGRRLPRRAPARGP
jgi:hypothetical protein